MESSFSPENTLPAQSAVPDAPAMALTLSHSKILLPGNLLWTAPLPVLKMAAG